MRLIDADALGVGKANIDVFEHPAYADGWNTLIDIIEKAPTVEAEPVRHGHWEYWAGSLVKCSVCGYEYTDWLVCDNYCGNCGAKMDEETEVNE